MFVSGQREEVNFTGSVVRSTLFWASSHRENFLEFLLSLFDLSPELNWLSLQLRCNCTLKLEEREQDLAPPHGGSSLVLFLSLCIANTR